MKFDLTRPVLYLITSGEATDEGFARASHQILETIRRAVTKGVGLVQIREKAISGENLYRLASDAAKLVRGSGTRLLINDRIDIAIASGVDGVHLTTTSLPVYAVRSIAPPEFLIGSSTHSLSEVDAARVQGADFVIYGPVFATPGKGEPKGLGDLAEVCRQTKGLPVIALGGIDAKNIDQAIAAGAAGGAAIRWLNEMVTAE